MRRLRVRDPQGLTLGLLFVAVATAALVLSSGYRMGSATDMGPGYVPRLFGAFLLLIGAAVVVNAFRIDGPSVDWRPTLRPTAILAVGIGLFALALRPLGVIASVILLVLVSAAASPESRLKETVLSALVVAALCGGIFVQGLGLQAPLWPWFWR